MMERLKEREKCDGKLFCLKAGIWYFQRAKCIFCFMTNECENVHALWPRGQNSRINVLFVLYEA